MKMNYLILSLLFSLSLSCNITKPKETKKVIITPLENSTSASFRGIASWGADELWVGGTGGTLLHSKDGGASFEKIAIPNIDSLDFRDIEVLDKNTVLLMSIGNGTASRIYKTTDAGKTWNLTFQNQNPKAFFDGIDFWDEQSGLMISDPIDDQLLLYKTTDAGLTWNRVGANTLPPLEKGEYGFAASGTGIVTINNNAWISTGGAKARIFKSSDLGESWDVSTTPVPAGNPSSGIFSIAFRDTLHGVAVGGDYQDPHKDEGNIAITTDGGTTWELIKNEPPIFHKACVQYLGDTHFLATGRTGTALSRDDGKHWEIVDTNAYYCITFDMESGVGYLAGAKGQVAKFVWEVKKGRD